MHRLLINSDHKLAWLTDRSLFAVASPRVWNMHAFASGAGMWSRSLSFEADSDSRP